MNPTGDTIPKRFLEVVEQYPEITAFLSKDEQEVFQPTTYAELKELIARTAAAFSSIGIKRGDHIGLISDNRKEWYMTDIAVLSLGAVDVPRGSDTTLDEIEYILGHADCRVCIAEDKAQTEKILERKTKLPNLKQIIILDKDGENVDKSLAKGVDIHLFHKLQEKGKNLLAKTPDFLEKEISLGKGDDVVTIIYTSGTTGEPKGVMLTNRNYTFQLDRIYDHVPVQSGEVFLSVLPIWHSFERAVDYVVMNRGATIAYSKLIGKIMLEDFKKVRPHWMTSVPRIWELVRNSTYRKINEEKGAKRGIAMFLLAASQVHASLATLVEGRLPQFRKRSRFLDVLIGIIPLILFTPLKGLGTLLVFKKIKASLGGRFIAGISGGGALPPYVDQFFQAAGIMLLEGYGLTETGPILAVRLLRKPVTSTVGPLLRDIQYKILDKEGREVGPGEKGVLWVKSDQVMQGYYKRPEATEAVLQNGWLNTGDITMATVNNEIKIIGREKETIVLMGGENIEPTPIEERLVQSEYIDQVMVVGQDMKYLAALIIPNREKVEKTAEEKSISYLQYEDLVAAPEIQEIINDEVQGLINNRNGFKNFERIYRSAILPNHFEAGKELTQTLKVKRDVVNDLYKKEISKLFA